MMKIYREYPFADNMEIGTFTIYSVFELHKWNTMYAQFDAFGIVIGSCCNGDWIGIPDGKASGCGFIDHETFGYDESDDLNYIKVSGDIGKFIQRAHRDESMPDDYDEALQASRQDNGSR